MNWRLAIWAGPKSRVPLGSVGLSEGFCMIEIAAKLRKLSCPERISHHERSGLIAKVCQVDIVIILDAGDDLGCPKLSFAPFAEKAIFAPHLNKSLWQLPGLSAKTGRIERNRPAEGNH